MVELITFKPQDIDFFPLFHSASRLWEYVIAAV